MGEAYSCASGGEIHAGRYKLPAYARSAPIGAWSLVPGTPQAVDQFSGENQALTAFCGMAVRYETAELTTLAGGGHGDSSDNRVQSIGLLDDVPSLLLRQPASASADRVQDVAYYNDGKPSSRHTYSSSHWIPEVQRYIDFGALYVWGGGTTFPNSDGFDPVTNTWDAPGTWANGGACCREQNSGVIWVTGTYAIAKWDPATNVFTTTYDGQYGPPLDVYRPICHDSKRNHLFALSWGNGEYGNTFGPQYVCAHKITAGGTVITPITFNPSAALTQFEADFPVCAAMDYDPGNDRYLFMDNQPGREDRIYVITPNDGTVWDIDFLTYAAGSVTLPASGPGGLWDKLRYIPRLRGFVLWTDLIHGVHYLRLK